MAEAENRAQRAHEHDEKLHSQGGKSSGRVVCESSFWQQQREMPMDGRRVKMVNMLWAVLRAKDHILQTGEGG